MGGVASTTEDVSCGLDTSLVRGISPMSDSRRRRLSREFGSEGGARGPSLVLAIKTGVPSGHVTYPLLTVSFFAQPTTSTEMDRWTNMEPHRSLGSRVETKL